MADPLMIQRTGYSPADLASSLRIGAACGAESCEIWLPPKEMLELARIIERGLEPARLVAVEEEPILGRWQAVLWALMIATQVQVLLTPLALQMMRLIRAVVDG